MAGKKSEKILGIGGIFFRAKNPEKLSKWYQKHLGISIKNSVALFTWQSEKRPHKKGYTVWSIFPAKSQYFEKRNQFMINYRVKNLQKFLEKLRKEKVRVSKRVEISKYGKFGWAYDSEGYRMELWERPTKYVAPEEEIAME